jgi:DNA repair exonuclease SbcCD nuclease subunit
MVSNKPIAVLISDIHYSLKNLELADNSMRQAIAKANDLQVPLIVAGDLRDTKANMRAEEVNRLIETFKLVRKAYIMVGNHDKINEKSEDHSLNFLASDKVVIVDKPLFLPENFIKLIPYQNDIKEFKDALGPYTAHIAHQGIQGSDSGEYIQDKTAITKDDVAGLRVISGHYHKRQTIDLPDGGKWDYIGNPFSQNFAEANDPEKGFQILMDDGSLEFVPTNLRKHVVYDLEHIEPGHGPTIPYREINPNKGDLVWVKFKGTKASLSKYSKEKIQAMYGLENFKLDLIPTDIAPQASKKQNLTQPQLLDSIIDSLAIDDDRKTAIKDAWRTRV